MCRGTRGGTKPGGTALCCDSMWSSGTSAGSTMLNSMRIIMWCTPVPSVASCACEPNAEMVRCNCAGLSFATSVYSRSDNALSACGLHSAGDERLLWGASCARAKHEVNAART